MTRARIGLPAIKQFNYSQLQVIHQQGGIDMSLITEKPDGCAFVIGYDDRGFFTQSSLSSDQRMRSPSDYMARADNRYHETEKLNMAAVFMFSHVHMCLHNNNHLQQYLYARHLFRDVLIRCELLYRPCSKVADEHISPLHVGYHKDNFGTVAMIVIHSQLLDKTMHDLDLILLSSNAQVKFHTDICRNAHGSWVQLTYPVLLSKLSDDVDKHIETTLTFCSRWGNNQPEGFVVHPTTSCPMQPRFKVTSPSFRQYMQSRFNPKGVQDEAQGQDDQAVNSI